MPLGPRVLVRLIKGDDKSATGLFLPPGAKDAHAEAAYAKVVEVARAGDEEGEGFGENVSGIPDGANILFEKTRGVPVPWDENLRILDVKDVLALVEELSLDEAN